MFTHSVRDELCGEFHLLVLRNLHTLDVGYEFVVHIQSEGVVLRLLGVVSHAHDLCMCGD